MVFDGDGEEAGTVRYRLDLRLPVLGQLLRDD
jgi:hypothetical protein